MAQPVVRILTAEQAEAAAGALRTPSAVRAFVELRKESSAVREFMRTPEWAAIHGRIIGDGTPPLDPHSLKELARMARWAADGELGGEVSEGARGAYLHMAHEIDLLAREMGNAPVSLRVAGAALTGLPGDARAA